MNSFLYILLGIVIVIITGCNGKEETLNLKGDIAGFVKIVDEFGEELEDKSGIEVKIDGKNYSAKTNEIGKYEIKNVPSGTYNVSYIADSCGMEMIPSFQHVGGNVATYVDECTLYKLPTYEPDTIKVYKSNGIVQIEVWFNDPSKEYYARIYFGNSPEVSIDNYLYSNTISSNRNSAVGISTGFFIEGTPLSGISPIYYVVYQFNYYGPNAGYYDYNAGKQVYTCFRKVTEARELIAQ